MSTIKRNLSCRLSKNPNRPIVKLTTDEQEEMKLA